MDKDLTLQVIDQLKKYLESESTLLDNDKDILGSNISAFRYIEILAKKDFIYKLQNVLSNTYSNVLKLLEESEMEKNHE